MNKAVFWDRDGIINPVVEKREDGVKNASPQRFEDFKLVDGAFELLNQVKAKGFLNIIVTNQPDIARNKMSWGELNKMHDFLKQGIPVIDAIYVCPHDINDNCNCRKPKPGLLLDAAKDYNINLAECYVVGDSQKDLDAAKAVGVKSILLRTDYNSEVKNADFEAKSLQDIAKIIK